VLQRHQIHTQARIRPDQLRVPRVWRQGCVCGPIALQGQWLWYGCAGPGQLGGGGSGTGLWIPKKIVELHDGLGHGTTFELELSLIPQKCDVSDSAVGTYYHSWWRGNCCSTVMRHLYQASLYMAPVSLLMRPNTSIARVSPYEIN
jgi:hypothetical protein